MMNINGDFVNVLELIGPNELSIDKFECTVKDCDAIKQNLENGFGKEVFRFEQERFNFFD